MRKEEIFKAINEWQMDAGEDFLDYFDGSFNAVSFMFWARGKGYISTAQLNLWEEEKEKPLNDADTMKVIYDCDVEEGDFSYSVVSSEDWIQEYQDTAYGIFAEFVSESITYQKRLKEFLEEN